MQPAYYNNLGEIKNKFWSMLEDAITNRGSQFRIPVFICANQDEVDGRIVVLRKSDRENNLLPVTELVDKYYEEVQGLGGNRWDTSSLIKRFRK